MTILDLKYSEPEVFQISPFPYFGIFVSISWATLRIESRSKEFTAVSWTPYCLSMKVMLYNMLNNALQEIKLHAEVLWDHGHT